jgi:single-strand DNA-binding protein
MNTVTMTGRLTKDPKLRHAGDRAICDMRIAVDNGRHPSTYIDVTAFDGQAYTCAEFLSKGRKVGVAGRLALREWEGSDGHTNWRYSVIGRVEFLDRPPEREPEAVDRPDPEPAESARPELALAA